MTWEDQQDPRLLVLADLAEIDPVRSAGKVARHWRNKIDRGDDVSLEECERVLAIELGLLSPQHAPAEPPPERPATPPAVAWQRVLPAQPTAPRPASRRGRLGYPIKYAPASAEVGVEFSVAPEILIELSTMAARGLRICASVANRGDRRFFMSGAGIGERLGISTPGGNRVLAELKAARQIELLNSGGSSGGARREAVASIYRIPEQHEIDTAAALASLKWFDEAKRARRAGRDARRNAARQIPSLSRGDTLENHK